MPSVISKKQIWITILHLFFINYCLSQTYEVYSDTSCYGENKNSGLNFYDDGNYSSALENFKQAELCNDIPENSNIQIWIEKTDKCLKMKIAADKMFDKNELSKAAIQYANILKINKLDKYCRTKYNICIGADSMVYVEGGSFMMGSNQGTNREKPVHKVVVKSFLIDRCEVTVAKYRQFCSETGKEMPEMPAWGWIDDHPIVNITWDDANNFAQWAGKRLPTEAEWEYAAQGGKKSKNYNYSGSNSISEIAWWSENADRKTHQIAGKDPNELNIFDMSGNVWEYCSDWYASDYYAKGESQNPQGPNTGTYKIIRGGAWSIESFFARIRMRSFVEIGFYSDRNGFRCVKDIE